MSHTRNHKISIIVGLFILGMLLTSCKPQVTQPVPDPGTYLIDPMLREFYATLGGNDVLGPAISAMFNLREEQCQYTQNALLCFNSQAQGIDRYQLYPLGNSMSVADQNDVASVSLVGGETISVYEEFSQLYNRLYGSLYVGHPLTKARFNPHRNRIEQYFENVGFYRDIDTPYGQVHLLSYGVYACSRDCRYTVADRSVVVPSPPVLEQPFQAQIVRLGGQTIFGMPLSEPYQAVDGNTEQIYENVVLYAPPDDPTDVHFRNTPLALGYSQTSLLPDLYGQAEGMVFYPLEGDKGHHVPVDFDHFIASHGGLEISGKPIDEARPLEDGQFRQCFENYCLDYTGSADPADNVHLELVGAQIHAGLRHPRHSCDRGECTGQPGAAGGACRQSTFAGR